MCVCVDTEVITVCVCVCVCVCVWIQRLSLCVWVDEGGASEEAHVPWLQSTWIAWWLDQVRFTLPLAHNQTH